MKLFTVGPVEMNQEILEQGGKPLPYFRTAEFSRIMFEIQDRFLELADSEEGSKLITLTASGTGAMEAVVVNTLTKADRCLIIDGGGFGHRFTEICALHSIPFESIKLSFGETLTEKHLAPYEGRGITALLVNIDETSTAQLYDCRMLGEFCRRNGCLYIVDAISSFLADEFSMKEAGVDAAITASQKALALPPGLSFVILSPKVIRERIGQVPKRSFYFDFETYLLNMERGQPPFTPAVGIILQLQLRLREICEKGIGIEIQKHKERAEIFRQLCLEAGLKLPSYPMSNAVTALVFPDGGAENLFRKMKDIYGKMLTPCGGELKDTVLRVGHLGSLTAEDYKELIAEIKEVLAE